MSGWVNTPAGMISDNRLIGGMCVNGETIWTPKFTPYHLFHKTLSQGVWYDPSDLSTLFQDHLGTIPAAYGQPVGLMRDKSGRGNHASQPVATARPTLMQDAGGRAYLQFDGVDDFIQAPPESSPLGATPSYLSVVARYESATFVSNAGLVVSGSGTTRSARAIGVESTGMIKVDMGSPGNAAPTFLPVPTETAVWEAKFGQAVEAALNGGAFVSTVSVANTQAGGLTLGRGISGIYRQFRLFGAAHLIVSLAEKDRAAWVQWAKMKGGIQ